MAEYQQVKIGKLRLKGANSGAKRKKRKKEDPEAGTLSNANVEVAAVDEDALQHGGWWLIKSYEHLSSGNVAVQVHNNRYLFAVDNGSLCIGDQHAAGVSGPEDAEIFAMVKVSQTKIALKTGYGKYVSVNALGELSARAEAVGPREQFDVVIEDDKTALQGHNGYFVAVSDGGEIRSLSSSVKGDHEIVRLRTNASKVKRRKEEDDANAESMMNVRQCEVNYVKQFQSFGDHKMRLHQGPESSLEKARKVGKLHEAMLDRREKMKADRYCK